MERPAILNRSMPATAGATINILPVRAVYEAFQREIPSRGKKRNLHLVEEVYQRESRFPRDIRISAHASRRLLTLHPKTCSLFALITSSCRSILQEPNA